MAKDETLQQQQSEMSHVIAAGKNAASEVQNILCNAVELNLANDAVFHINEFSRYELENRQFVKLRVRISTEATSFDEQLKLQDVVDQLSATGGISAVLAGPRLINGRCSDEEEIKIGFAIVFVEVRTSAGFRRPYVRKKVTEH